MDDELDLLIPSVEVNMEVDDAPLMFNDDDEIINAEIEKYAKEMLDSGYKECDAEHLRKTFKSLDDIKFIKMHCTSCDKHIGSAPNNLHIRFQHPLLKVLLCGSCFEFYCSGEFEKGEDGSELYCRWCGDGGNVFCCSTCPFVFCRKCIRKNLGRGVAKSVQEQDTWVCLQCDPEQISHHRAAYWAMQKFSEQMQEKYKGTDSAHLLDEDANRCCSVGKKRTLDGTEKEKKTRQPKKPRMSRMSYLQSALLDAIPSTSQEQGKHWMDTSTSDPQDEVVCTPDIIAIDDSPPNSPSVAWQHMSPPPLAPPPLVRAPKPAATSKNTIIVVAPATQDNQFSLRIPAPSKGQPLMWHLPEGLKATSNKNASPSQINPKKLSELLTTKIVYPRMKPGPKVSVPKVAPAVSAPPVSAPAVVPAVVVPSTPLRVYPRVIAPVPPPPPAPSPTATIEVTKDWFELALVECAEITEYVSTKISSLAGVHSRSYRSTQLMEELHNTLQTYMHVALEKIQKMKVNTRKNFVRDMSEKRNVTGIVPTARVKVHPKNLPTQSVIPPAPSSLNENSDAESVASSGEHTISDDDDDDDSRYSKTRGNKKTTEKRKNNIINTNNVQPEDALFDMEVTNESDEERSSSRATSVTYSEKDQEIIDLIDSSSEGENEMITESPVPTFPDKGEDQNEENKTSEDKISENETNEDEAASNSVKILIVSESEEQKKDSSSKVTSTQEEDIKIEIHENEIKKELNDDKIKNGEIKADENDVKISTNDVKENTIKCEKAEQENGAIKNGLKENEDEDKNDTVMSKVEEEKDKPEKEIEEEPMDVEEMLSSNVVLRSKQNEKASNFDAEFSKFIGNSGPLSDDEELSSSPISEEDEPPETASKEKAPETAAKDKTPEPEIARKEQTPEPENATKDQTPESETAAKDLTPEPETAAKEQIPETAEKDQTPEPEIAAKDQTPEPKIAAKNQTPEPETAAKEQTPEPETAVKKQTPEPEEDDSLDSGDLDILPDLLNKDNGSLSLPPTCDKTDFRDVKNKKVNKATNSNTTTEIDKNGDLVLDSGILALKQMAENCVTSAIEIQQTTTA